MEDSYDVDTGRRLNYVFLFDVCDILICGGINDRNFGFNMLVLDKYCSWVNIYITQAVVAQRFD